MQSPEVSVLIPTYNKAKYLNLSLASWCHQRFQHRYELIVVDDGCTDSTRQLLEHYSGRLPLRYVSTTNKGRAAARNIALELARGALVLFVDDDRVVPADFVQCHWRAHAADAPPSVVIGWTSGLLVELPGYGDQLIPERVVTRMLEREPAVSERLLAGGDMQILRVEGFESGIPQLDQMALPDPWEIQLGQIMSVYGSDITECPLAWTCGTTGNLSISRECLEHSGGFDEVFEGWGLEDTELHYRLVKAGLRTKIDKSAVNYHQNHPKNRRRQMLNWMTNAKWLLGKHESHEVALYIQAAIGNVSLLEACRLLTEAKRSEGSANAAVYGRLLIESARRLLEC